MEFNLTDKEIMELGDKMYLDIEIRNRSYLFRTYKNVFLGNEAVKYIMKETDSFDADIALKIGQKMIDLGVFSHCLRDHPLKNEALYYRFLRDEKHKGGLEVDPQLKKTGWKDAVGNQ